MSVHVSQLNLLRLCKYTSSSIFLANVIFGSRLSYYRTSFVLLFLRIDVGIDVNDDVKSLLEIFLIQFVGETLLSSSTGFL